VPVDAPEGHDTPAAALTAGQRAALHLALPTVCPSATSPPLCWDGSRRTSLAYLQKTGTGDIRFKKSPPYECTDTPRKRAALRRKQRREREALPLFAEQIAEEQPSEDEEMAHRTVASAAQAARWRDDRAPQWRKARCMIDALPVEGTALYVGSGRSIAPFGRAAQL